MMRKSTKLAPAQDIFGNLHFSPFGVFAYWIVTPPDRPLANAGRLAAAAAAHREFTDLLPLRPGLVGTSTLKDPRFIYRQQAAGVDLNRYPLYRDICLGRQREAEAVSPRFPVYWMFVRLEPPASVANPLSVLHRRLTRAGFLTPKPSAQTVEQYWQLMLDVEQMIPPQFAALRPTGAQLQWFYRRQHGLGVLDEPLPLPEVTDAAVAGYRWEPAIDVSEPRPPGRSPFAPMLRVESFDDGQKVSYQIHAVVRDFPAGGIYFPGSNFTSLIADLEDPRTGERVHADWSQRASLIPLNKAHRRNAASFRKLNEQYDQQAGRRSTRELAESEEALSDFEVELSVHPREAEVEFTTYFSVGASSPEAAQSAFAELRGALEGVHVAVSAPAGVQERLFRATRPGLDDISLENSFAQYTSRTGWSRYIPMTTTRFGDSSGRVIGLNKMSADLDFVFLNTRGKARQVSSGGMFVGGDPRKGKTHFMMLNAAEEAVSGGCVVMYDATPGQQWRKFASAVPNSGVINLAEGQCTVDPILLIGGRAGNEYLVDEICRIAGHSSNSEIAVELRLLVDSRAWASAAELVEVLAGPQCPPVLASLGRQLLSWAATTTGEALFGRLDPASGRRTPLPALSLRDVSLLVVETQDLNLPTEAEAAAAASGDDELTSRQMIGQSVMAMFAVYLRSVFYGRQSRDVLGFDEGWRTVSMKVLKDLVFEILRTGPAANTDVWLISQKPWRDFPDLDDDLARVRAVFGVESSKEAALAAQWMGVDPDRYPHIVDQIATGLSPRTRVRDPFHRSSEADVIARDRMGECLLRIGDGDLGWVKTSEMVFPEWEAAADTRPELT